MLTGSRPMPHTRGMGFSNGLTKVAATVTVSGTVPPPGNAPNNSLTTTTATQITTPTQELTYGTSAGKVDIFCAGEFLIPPSGSLTLNLFDGGSTTNDLVRVGTGAPAEMVNVKSLTLVVSDGGDASGVAIGDAASDAFFGFFDAADNRVKIYPAGPPLLLGAPSGATVSGSAKNVKIENLSSAAAVTVRVTASGTSVAPGMGMGPMGLTYA